MSELKPTYGLVPAYPPNTTRILSHAKPAARTIRDAALMLRVVAAPDDRDPLSFPSLGVDFVAVLEGGAGGLRIAWSPTLGYAPVNPGVRAAMEKAAQHFHDLACRMDRVDRVFDDPEAIWAPLFYTDIAARLHDYLDQWRDRMDPGLVQAVEAGWRLEGATVLLAAEADEAAA